MEEDKVGEYWSEYVALCERYGMHATQFDGTWLVCPNDNPEFGPCFIIKQVVDNVPEWAREE